MRLIFFSKMFKIESKLGKYKKIEEKFFVSEIIAPKDVAINCFY